MGTGNIAAMSIAKKFETPINSPALVGSGVGM